MCVCVCVCERDRKTEAGFLRTMEDRLSAEEGAAQIVGEHRDE